MKQTLVTVAALAALGGAQAAFGQTATPAAMAPSPADVPVPKPVAVGLAGAGKPDLVRFLMVKGASQARLSPDGTRMAYLSNITGEPQVWIVDAVGGAPPAADLRLDGRQRGLDAGRLGPALCGRYRR
ncbi:PD40 domain-containing protein [Caulobacter sp. HMWF025]|uniref:PD40 domain-containing protein n=1 Tax=Caulobacter sp. HMWF025 TaxID=2056860 RepID=UPI001304A11D|nr:PD40 domain-containing protein [Caulobacter sp. HMWF025]